MIATRFWIKTQRTFDVSDDDTRFKKIGWPSPIDQIHDSARVRLKKRNTWRQILVQEFSADVIPVNRRIQRDILFSHQMGGDPVRTVGSNLQAKTKLEVSSLVLQDLPSVGDRLHAGDNKLMIDVGVSYGLGLGCRRFPFILIPLRDLVIQVANVRRQKVLEVLRCEVF